MVARIGDCRPELRHAGSWDGLRGLVPSRARSRSRARLATLIRHPAHFSHRPRHKADTTSIYRSRGLRTPPGGLAVAGSRALRPACPIFIPLGTLLAYLAQAARLKSSRWR